QLLSAAYFNLFVTFFFPRGTWQASIVRQTQHLFAEYRAHNASYMQERMESPCSKSRLGTK
ncbi:MAG: hypothetical protein WAL78_16290, partial [Candidatus Acidiferrales bacterium]